MVKKRVDAPIKDKRGSYKKRRSNSNDLKKSKKKTDSAKAAKRRPRKRPKRGFGSWSVVKKVVAILASSMVVAATALVVVVASKMDKITQTKINPEKLSITEEVEERLTGYTNIALFGVDSRDAELGVATRSDTIMIASINNETKEVKISSVYRDTLMQLSDGTYNKANAAHSFGGPEAAVAMLNKNLDLNITKYITVNFNAMISVIDAVGGIEIDVQPEEVDYITGYACEIIEATGIDSEGVFEPGLQKLNGVQATAYARIRYTDGDDFRRAERQREVLQKIIEKLQKANISVLNSIADSVFPQISTNFTLPEVLSYGKHAKKYTLLETTGFPFEKTTNTLNGVGSIVVPTTMESNVIELHRYFFGEDGYTPSSTVTMISKAVASRTSSGGTGSSNNNSNNNYNNNSNNNYNNNSNNNSNNNYNSNDD